MNNEAPLAPEPPSPPPPPLRLTICAKREACELMRSSEYDALISINDPSERPNFTWHHKKREHHRRKFQAALDTGLPEDELPRPSLFLWFWDTLVEERDAPDIGHIRVIRAFAASLPFGSRLLIHCRMGISRSTAAAIIALKQCGMSGIAATIEVLRLRPIAIPNTLMLELASRPASII